MTATVLLSLLDKVKPTGKGRYQARCPVPEHADKGPSLSIREMDDGLRPLRCQTHEAGTGRTVQALPPAPLHGLSSRRSNAPGERRPFAAADALRAVGFEALVVCAASAAMATGEPLSSVDRERLLQAGERIQSALSGAGL
jgi:hypothetical protein